MKKAILLAAPLGLLVAYGTSQVTAQDGQCEQMDIPPVCQPASRININNNSKNVSPPNICVSAGQSITVSVSPAGTTASVEGKGGGWPYGSGSDFTLEAPGSGDYDYNVIFEDGSCLDPRITVQD